MHKAHPHPVCFASWAGQTAIGFWVLDQLSSHPFLHQRFSEQGHTFYEWLFMGFVLWVAIFGFFAWLDRQTTVYALADNRMWVRRGWLQRQQSDFPWHRIESLSLHQSLLGRMFNYGTLVVHGTGGAMDVLRRVPDPIDFQKRIQYRIDNAIVQKEVIKGS